MGSIRYVAFIDILGFKALVEKFQGRSDELGQMMKELFTSAILAAMTGESVHIRKHPDPRTLPTDVMYYQFSDSVIFYTRDDTSASLEKIVKVLCLLFARASLIGFPLRGGLVKGEIYADPPIILGRAVNKAYELEGKQNWSGLIVDDSCFAGPEEQQTKNRLLQQKWMVKTTVPIKGEPYGAEMHVINWAEFVGLRLSSMEVFQANLTKYVGHPKTKAEKEKIANTISFLKAYIGSSPLPSFLVPAILREP